jgi:hypothetical protein
MVVSLTKKTRLRTTINLLANVFPPVCHFLYKRKEKNDKFSR